ncbi:hypothetical protein [Weissella tructae]
MNTEQEYINNNFFQVEDVPKLLGMDIDGNAIYASDEVYVVGDKYLLTKNARPQARSMAQLLNLEVKVL